MKISSDKVISLNIMAYMQVSNGTGLGVRMNKRPLVACYLCHKCYMEAQ